MTKSEMFKLAHARAKEDRAFDKTALYPEGHSYAYYFRLQLIGLYADRKPVRMTALMERELGRDGRIGV